MKNRTYWQWVRIGLSLHLGVFLVAFVGLAGFILFQSFLRQLRLEPIKGTILKSVAVPRGDETFTPDIWFSYTVDRRKYNGGKYRDGFRPLSLSESEVEAILQRYPHGSTVEAWYDPKYPRYAVLDRSLGPIHYGLMILIGSLVVGGILLLVFIRRRRAGNISR